jgi:transcriptional regulator GlxA family with amidase domain
MGAFMQAGRHRVAVLARDGVLPLELGLVHQIFGQACAVDGTPLYEVITCGLAPGLVRTDADFAVVANHGDHALSEADTVVIPASHEQDEAEEALNEPLRRALTGIRPGTRIASICTGAFVLAAAGLLDGRRATTHWKSAALFARRFPQVNLDAAVLYVDEGDVLTSAGEASGIDLCLHMVRCDHGTAVANDVARRTVVFPHRDGGQAQFIPRPVPEPQLSSTTGPTRAWALEQLDQPLTLTDLATHAAVSVRTFTRRFREEVGLSAQEWLTQQRIERARHLLEETDLPIDQVAEQSGLGTAAVMRKHFARTPGISPSAYRSAFRGGPGAASPTHLVVVS